MGEIVPARAGVQEAFAAVDATLSQCVRSLAATSQRRGLLHAGFAELTSIFRGSDLRAVFGCGEAAGDNRAHEAAEALLKSPLLERGRQLKEIHSATIHVTGGPDLTLHEVQTLMEEAPAPHARRRQTFFGLAVDPALAGRLCVTLLGALPATGAVPAARRPPARGQAAAPARSRPRRARASPSLPPRKPRVRRRRTRAGAERSARGPRRPSAHAPALLAGAKRPPHPRFRSRAR